MSDEITLRPSSITSYLDCPRRFAARHLRNLVAAAGYEVHATGPSTAGALVGTGVHAGAAWTLEQMRDADTLGADADAVEVAIASFHDRIQIEGAEWDKTTDRPNTGEQQIKRMTTVFRRVLAPQIVPLLVETRVEATIAPGWIISGQLDTLAVARDDAQVIRDTKTGVSQRANNAQYGAYAMLFAAHDYNPKRIIEDYIPRVALKQEQPPPVSVEIDAHEARIDAHEAIQNIMRDAAEFEARAANPSGLAPRGAFRPNPASQLCSARWCPAHGTNFCGSHKRG